MNEEKKLLNLLYDSQLLLAENGLTETFWLKPPDCLRRVLRERVAKERLDPFALGGLTLGTNLLALQKSVEALKASWTAELQASEAGLDEFSYSEMLTYPADGLLAAEKYLQLYDERCLADVMCGLDGDSLTRAVMAAQFEAWDARLEEVYAGAAQSTEPTLRESVLGDRSLIARPVTRTLDVRRAAYVQAVHKFVLGQRLKERRAQDSALGDSLLRSEPDPRRDKAVETFFDELLAAAGGAEAAFIFAVAREVVCPLGRAESTRLQLVANAAQLLETDFYTKARRLAARLPLGREPSALPPSLLDPLEFLNHYFEAFALAAETRAAVFLERDSDGLALWAVCWLGLRAGQTRAVQALLGDYRGSLQAEAAGLAEALRGEGGGFVVNEGEDAFKRALFLLLCAAEGLPANFIVAEMSDYIWFHLQQARAQPAALDRLQRKMAALEVPQPLEAAKLNLLCLRLEEAVEALGRAAEAEAAQLAFFLLHSGAIPASGEERLRPAEALLLRFAQDGARKLPVETLAYLDALPPTTLPALVDFFEKNDLLGEFFSASPESRSRAARAETLLGRKWPVLLEALARRRDTHDVVLVRLCEERRDLEGLADLMIEQEARLLALTRRGEEEPQKEYQALLDRIFEEQRSARRVLGAEKLNQIVLLKQARTLMQLYAVKRKLRESFAFLERNKAFWDVPFETLENKVKLAYLELIRLALQVVLEARQLTRQSALRTGLGLEGAAATQLVRVIHDYVHRQVRLSELTPEEPFEDFEATAKEITKLFTAITLTE